MKNIVTHRPLAIGATVFIVCLLLFMNIDPYITFITGVLALSSLVAVIIYGALKKRRFLPLACILSSALLAGCISLYYNEIYYKNEVAALEGVHECEFVVTDNVKYDSYYTVSHVTLTRVDLQDCKIRTVLISSFMAVLDEGRTYSAKLELTPTKSDFAFGDTYDFSKGFEISAYCEDTSQIKYVSEETHQPYSAISKIQKQISVFFNMYLDDVPTSLCKALLDGEKNDLPVSVKQDFSQLGISHMLAISGMHLSVIVGFLAVFINKFKFNKRVGFLILTAVTAIYVFLTGFTPSVLRASIMLIMTYLAFFVRRRSDGISSLVLSVSIICLVSANSVFDIGLWLSFLATLGILLIAVPLLELSFKDKKGLAYKILAWIWASVLVTLSASAFTFPIILMYFGTVSFAGVIANLIFTIPLTWLLLLIMLMVIISPIGFLTKWVAFVLNCSCHATLWLADKLAHPVYLLSLDFIFLYFICAAAIFCVVVLLIKGKRALSLGVYAFVMAVVLILNIFASIVRADDCGLGYYSRGADDALYVKSGSNVLIVDNSNGGYTFLNEAIDQTGAQMSDSVTIMLTHYHIYLAYGISHLAENGIIDALILPSPDTNEINAYNAVVRAAQTYSIEVSNYDTGANSVMFNGISIAVYSQNLNDSVHDAVMIIVDTGGEVYAYATPKSLEAADDEIAREFVSAQRQINGSHGLEVDDKEAREHFYQSIDKKIE